MFWKSDCGGGDDCECNPARTAAIVRGVKPESDAHSIFPNKGTLWKHWFQSLIGGDIRYFEDFIAICISHMLVYHSQSL